MIYMLGSIATALTVFMFVTQQMMLGFPSAIFWAVFAGLCYQNSTATWDIYYLTFFASMGMTIFSMYAAYGLRTKREEQMEGDTYIDESKDDMVFIDESRNTEPEPHDQPSRRVQEIRERAARRKATGVRRKIDWGEFK